MIWRRKYLRHIDLYWSWQTPFGGEVFRCGTPLVQDNTLKVSVLTGKVLDIIVQREAA